MPVFRDGRITRVRESDLRRYVDQHVLAPETREPSRRLSLVASAPARPRRGRLWD
jgi:hypothetical protein